MSDWITAAVTALACFAITGGCVVYLYKASGRLRWSRRSKTLVLRHPLPVVFWTKIIVVGAGALLCLSMGILLLVFHGHRFLHSADSQKPLFEQVRPDANP